MRPWAVRVRTSRRRSICARTFSATCSSTSAAFVPASRCSIATMATWFRSRLSMRLATTLERVVERDAELLVGERAPELAARRLAARVDGDGERADEAVAGPERRRDHVQVVGQLLRELGAQPAQLEADEPSHHDRHDESEERTPDGRDHGREHRADQGRRAPSRRRSALRSCRGGRARPPPRSRCTSATAGSAAARPAHRLRLWYGCSGAGPLPPARARRNATASARSAGRAGAGSGRPTGRRTGRRGRSRARPRPWTG